MIPNWMRSMFGKTKSASAAKGKRGGRPARFRPAVFLLEEREVPATYVVADATEAALTAAINAALADANASNTISFTASPAFDAAATINLASNPGAASFYTLNKSFIFDAPNGVTINRTNAASFRFFDVAATNSVSGLNNDVTLTGISLTNGQAATGLSGGAINYTSAGTLTINGGALSNNNANQNGGAIAISAGVLDVNGTTFNANSTTSGDGGAIFISGGTGHTVTNGTLTNNVAGDDGGAIQLDAGTLVVDPTTINGNTAADDGGGVNVTAGTFTLSAGDQVTNNTATAGDGGGIALQGGTGHTLTGATIASNHANAGRGGGLFVTNTNVTLDAMTIGGAALANANTAANGGGIGLSVAAAVTFTNANTIRFNTATANGGGIDLDTAATTLLTIGNNVTLRDNRITAAAGQGGGISARGGSLTLNNASILANQANLAGSRGGGLYISGTAVVNANGTTTIGSAGNANTAAGNGGGVHVDGGTFTLASTATITANTAGSIGGGLYQSDGIANINGTISNNQATGNGGGVFLIGGTLNFNTGAAITGNSTGASGGGIVVASVGVATLRGTISNNTATTSPTGAGGGLLVAGGTATLNGATIGGPLAADGNDAVDGGGIAVSAGTLTFSTAVTTVRFNTATQNGGGFALLNGFTGTVNAAALLNVLDNTITGTNGRGAGIAVLGNATFTMTGGAISRNSFVLPGATDGSGGGIYLSDGNVNISGFTIGGAVLADGNSASGYGGGVHVDGGTFTLGANAAISFNTASIVGGGLFQSDGTAEINGTISNNQSTTLGGGAFVVAGQLNLNVGSTVTSNTAGTNGGGVVVSTAGSADIRGTISNNTATGDGGGLFVAGGSASLDGATIGGPLAADGNDAANGGGIAVSGGALTLTSTTVRNNVATTGSGGGLRISGGGLHSITTSTIAANRALAGNGGGIALDGGTVAFLGITVGGPTLADGNQAINGGGIAVSAGSLSFGALSTVQFNSASQNGGGLALLAGFLGSFDADLFVSFLDNRVTGASGHGAGVAVLGNSTFLMAGGVIARNSFVLPAATGGTGGGLYQNGGTVIIAGITFGGALLADGNSATDSGGAIHVNAGTLSLTNTTIRNNAAGTGSGGGVFITGGGPHSIASSTIASNRALAGDGGGINASATFGGTLTITGSTVGGATVADGNQASAAGSGGGINFAAGSLTINAAATTIRNNTAGIGAGIRFSGTALSLTNTVVSNNTAALRGGGLAIFSGTNLILNATIRGNTANGPTIATDGGGGIFQDGGSTTTDPTIIDGNTSVGNGGGVNVLAGAFIMSAGDEVTNNSSTGGSGGGINFAGGTGHTLTSVIIAQNTAFASGGGVNLAATLAAGTVGIVTSTIGGAVTTNPTTLGNSAGASGGGIHAAGGVLTLTGSTVGGTAALPGNTTTAGEGGGLNVAGATVTVTGGTIGGTTSARGNTAATNGGGIAFSSGTLSFAGAATLIQFNNATAGSGGGLDISSGANVSIANGTDFLDNDANTSGGGIAQRGGGILTVTGADILRNNATNNSGGGVSLTGNGNSSITTSTISANSAAINGGGVFKSGTGNLTITGGTIGGAALANGNTAGQSGGGAFVNSGLLTASGATIANNTATAGDGGGVFVGTVDAGSSIATSAFRANRAVNGGAINVGGGFASTLALTTLTLGGLNAADANTATASGGGLNATGIVGSTITFTLSTIANNTALSGGGVALASGTLNMTNDTVSLNSATGVGGGININGALASASLNSVTVARNTATVATGGIAQIAGSLSIVNTISALNTGPGAGTDINVTGGAIANGGFNLFQTNNGFALAGTDVPSPARLAPLLADLGDYGGPTLTIALLPGSPALNAGSSPPAPATDQRGLGIVGGTRDIGAFESRGFVLTANAPLNLATIVNNVFVRTSDPQVAPPAPAALSVTVANGPGGAALNEPVAGGRVRFAADTVVGATATIANNPQPLVGVADNTGVAVIVGTTATSGTITANAFLGSYGVDVSAGGAATLNDAFTLKNRGVKTITLAAPISDAISGTSIGQNSVVPGQIAIQLRDQDGVLLPLAGVNVSRSFAATPNSFDPAFVPTITGPAGPIATGVDGAGNGSGIAIYAGLTAQTCAEYTLTFSTPTNDFGGGVALVADTFLVRASQLRVSTLPARVRSAVAIPAFTVDAVGVNGSRDLFFNTAITIAETGPGTFVLPNTATPTVPAGLIPPSYAQPGPYPAPANPPLQGRVTFTNIALDRAGNYTIVANATSLGTPISGTSNTFKINARTIVVTSANSLGSAIFNPKTNTNVMPPTSVRSALQTSLVQPGADIRKDVLIVTVEGRDILNLPADIDATVKLEVNTAVQNRNGVNTNVKATTILGSKLPGNQLVTANSTTATFAGNANLTLSKWGTYTLKATATGVPALPTPTAISPAFQVIARTISVISPPLLVVGPFVLKTAARDVTGDIAQNYDPNFWLIPDPTVVSISDIAQRQRPSIVGTGGTIVSTSGSSVVAKANPVRGVTTFSFVALAPQLVGTGTIDFNEYFIGSSSTSIIIDTLEPGRRRPRPVPTQLNLRLN